MKYLNDLCYQIKLLDLNKVNLLKKKLITKKNKNIFICGNGGSSSNANHISNDLMLGFGKKKIGFKFISLCSNVAKITCIANDLSYKKIFSHQLSILGKRGDLLIVLSGSGNSDNILDAIKLAKENRIETFGIIGFDGGKARKVLDNYIHTKINDMQISEDLQLIIMNYIMKSIIKDNKVFI